MALKKKAVLKLQIDSLPGRTSRTRLHRGDWGVAIGTELPQSSETSQGDRKSSARGQLPHKLSSRQRNVLFKALTLIETLFETNELTMELLGV